MAFAYDNLSHRPSGPFLRAASAVLPGVRAVQDQVAPYAAWWREHNARAASGDGPLWVAIGDSMTQGIGASAPDRGWAGQLSAELSRDGWPHRLVNLAVTGARVQDVLDRQLPALDGLRAEQDVALVTVMVGSNDLVRREYREGLVARFEALLPRLPRGAVVATLPNPRREVAVVDAMLRERAATGDVVLADLRSEGPHSWRGRLAPDFFHPNDLGYGEMAQVVRRAVDATGVTRTVS
ncbi:SGNH/GDSL hydrolase family protein [Lapillicoccus jejuensis]|uniref:Lysophospholipase L1-like esterase n=1 Tax=Lapillicoccus jejuensis TaxID=402171 RepID=A0A542E6D1_9MICO|nr:SGNH/GDSL hydrolase family protein [Lapillicoccus jejuensis]TQJ10895.1 lysophospholipase L1-like esterase [Lapillicoccus jejuensis]